MKKKNRFKFWLTETLHKWLNKLEPEYGVVKVEHTTVPLVTLESRVSISKRDERVFQEDIEHILAKELGKEVIKYANVDRCEKIDMSIFDEQIIYRATVKVAADKRG